MVLLDGLQEKVQMAKAQDKQRESSQCMISCLRGRRRQGSHDLDILPLLSRKTFMVRPSALGCRHRRQQHLPTAAHSRLRLAAAVRAGVRARLAEALPVR